MSKKIKGIFCAVLSAVMLTVSLSACSAAESEEKSTQQITEKTTVSTTVTTTENPETTFAETSTRKIYAGLSKRKSETFAHKICSYTTNYNSADETRTANLKASVDKIDKIVIPEGRVFSFNQTVGKRTVTAGYETAKVIKDGEFVDGLGGGVCQVSSTIFEAVLRANVEIVQRTNHTLEIGYVPLGGDATVQWNSRDFQFRNTLDSDIELRMTCENGRLTCTVYSRDSVDVGNVSIKITSSKGVYTLTRSVNGKVNYTTKSKYKKAKSE